MPGGQGRQSGRLLAHEQQRVLDETTRRRRLRKQLDALEQDNYHEDPHAHLQWHKKIPKFDDEAMPSSAAGQGGRKRAFASNVGHEGEPPAKKKKKFRPEHNKQRFRKNFAALLEEEMLSRKSTNVKESPYMAARAPEPKIPARHFCAVCGFYSKYTCIRCGTRYCSIKCRDVHNDTRI